MRFKAIQTCFIGYSLLKPGMEIELPDDTEDTPGVLEAMNRPPLGPPPELNPTNLAKAKAKAERAKKKTAEAETETEAEAEAEEKPE